MVEHLVSMIVEVCYNGGRGEGFGHVVEALATALTAFSDLKEYRLPSVSTQKHCILVCSSPPYDFPVEENFQFKGASLEKLCELYKENDIQFSLISPGKVLQFQTLFNQMGEPISGQKNIAADPSHMVLVRGFTLQERSISPQPVIKEEAFLAPSPGILPVASPVVAFDAKSNDIMSEMSPAPPQVGTSSMPAALPVTSAMPVTSQAPRPQQIQPAVPTELRPQRPVMNQSPSVPSPNTDQYMSPTPRPMVVTRPMGGNNDVTSIGGTAVVPMETTAETQILWRGTLEWMERRDANQAPAVTPKILQCFVYLSAGEHDINTARWPDKLQMQLIPHGLLKPLQPLFTNTRSVSFSFHDNDENSVQTLKKMLLSGCAGCVHFASATQCDIRIMMLLFSTKKERFMGLIPNDQTRFVTGIKTVITAHRNNPQALKVMGPYRNSFGGSYGYEYGRPTIDQAGNVAPNQANMGDAVPNEVLAGQTQNVQYVTQPVGQQPQQTLQFQQQQQQQQQQQRMLAQQRMQQQQQQQVAGRRLVLQQQQQQNPNQLRQILLNQQQQQQMVQQPMGQRLQQLQLQQARARGQTAQLIVRGGIAQQQQQPGMGTMQQGLLQQQQLNIQQQQNPMALQQQQGGMVQQQQQQPMQQNMGQQLMQVQHGGMVPQPPQGMPGSADVIIGGDQFSLDIS